MFTNKVMRQLSLTFTIFNAGVAGDHGHHPGVGAFVTCMAGR